MRPVLIWGAAGQAKVVTDTLGLLGGFEIVGYVDDVNPARRGEAFRESFVIGSFDDAAALVAKGVADVVLAIGANAPRQALAARLAPLGARFPVLVHPHATVSPSARLGAGTFVAAQGVVQADAVVGEHTLVNTGAIVEHDCVVGAAVHLSPRACLAGLVHVGDRAWVGVGATVRDRIAIGADTLVGAGAVVVSNLPAGVVAHGCPARIVKKAQA